MKCPNCNHMCGEKDLFCVNCGTKLSSVPVIKVNPPQKVSTAVYVRNVVLVVLLVAAVFFVGNMMKKAQEIQEVQSVLRMYTNWADYHDGNTWYYSFGKDTINVVHVRGMYHAKIGEYTFKYKIKDKNTINIDGEDYEMSFRYPFSRTEGVFDEVTITPSPASDRYEAVLHPRYG